MKVIGFTAEEQHEIFRLVTAILYLGNVQFVDDGKGGSTIADRQGTRTLTADPHHISLTPSGLTRHSSQQLWRCWPIS
jgi:myosin heavy subunit